MVFSSGASPHISVLRDEMLEYLAPKGGETYIDGTFGAGGYSRAILQQADCRVIAIDRDPSVQEFSVQLQKDIENFPGKKFTLLEGSFGEMAELLAANHITEVDGIVLDIGVSSMQLDRPERGFSFASDGPLDMRMGGFGKTAAELINNADEKELADVIYLYGEEHKARRIARKIVERRAEKPFTRTGELASLVRSVVPSGPKIDAATRTFQAIRIWVNDELGELERGLLAAEKLLAPGGRLVVVSFHSLEDGIVKRFMYERAGRIANVSRHQIAFTEEKTPEFTLLSRKAVKPGDAEVQRNIRSRSARLRALQRAAVGRVAA